MSKSRNQTSYNNATGAALTLNGHGLTNYSLDDRHGLVWLGLNERVNLTFASTEEIVGGLYVNNAFSKISFSKPDLDLIIAADKAANMPPLGFNPSVSTDNWVIVGEENASGLPPGNNDGDILEWDGAGGDWEVVAPSFLTATTGYTQADANSLFMLEAVGEAGLTLLNNKVDSIVSGTAHGLEVQDILNDPPLVALEGEVWIVGTKPTGAFVGHANELAWSDGVAWHFNAAISKETHYVEQQQGTYNFNGTAWVKIASTTAAIAGTTANGVGEIVGWPIGGALPDGLLALEGQILAINNFSELYAAIGNTYNAGTKADGTSTFAIPDFRGYFLRGEGANTDGTGAKGRGVGSTQSDQNKLHNHDVNYGDAISVFATRGKAFSLGGNTWSAGAIEGQMAATALGEQGGTEVRVKNVAVRWCIRIKGINAGIRGLTGKGYANGTAVGQTLSWDGTDWVPSAVAQLGWIYDRKFTGTHDKGTLDSKAFKTESGAKYKIFARYSSYWGHDYEYINFRINQNGKQLAVTNASAGAYRNAESLCAVADGTGNIETFSIEIFGRGGTLHDYQWVIERIK